MFMIFAKMFMSDYFDILDMLDDIDSDADMNNSKKKEDNQKKINYSRGLGL